MKKIQVLFNKIKKQPFTAAFTYCLFNLLIGINFNLIIYRRYGLQVTINSFNIKIVHTGIHNPGHHAV